MSSEQIFIRIFKNLPVKQEDLVHDFFTNLEINELRKN